MNNNYLVIIHDASKMIFSVEKTDFLISKEVREGVIYSPPFEGLDFQFLEERVKANDEEFEYNQTFELSNFTIVVYKNCSYQRYILDDDIVIGKDERSEILLNLSSPLFIKKEKGQNVLYSSVPIFVNGQIKQGTIYLEAGDYIYIDSELIFVDGDTIQVRSEIECRLMEEYLLGSKINHQSYHRSPRLYYVPNTDTIKIAPPPSKPKQEKIGLVKLILPPIITLAITVTISILMGRGIFILISITATLMALIKSVSSYFGGRKEKKEALEKREAKYSDYLVDKSIEINLRIQEELEASRYQLLAPKEITSLVKQESRRIYEKSIVDSDFLEIRIGNYTRKPNFKIELPAQKLTDDKDELYDNAKELVDSFGDLNQVGLSLDLKQSNLGIIGTKELAILIVEQILLELMTFHSYNDVQFLTIFNQEQLKDLEWLSYSPSSKIEAIKVRGLVYNEVLRDQILGSFTQILKDRDQKYKEEKDISFSPHYVVSVLSSDLIKEHSINEFLDRDLRHLGVSIIVVESEIESLKENIKSVVEIYSKTRCQLLIENGIYIRKAFEVDELPTKKELLQHARSLKGYNHVIGSENGLPKSVTFLEMYEVDKVDELSVSSRWKQSDSTKSLSVRLGVTGEEYVDLNLHEKAHGPHGLVAGTTGSGKSEIVQSYILSLAINFHPHEVAFLLIDYKGGGMANMFAKLPHLIGTITNLDKSGAMRALVSIKAELLRRQEIFAKYNVNHVNQYIRLFKNGEAEEPMPHLFLISDEFAELKQEQPEFMAELVSTARIGRSLGIHLILATQKPSGVVDSQIWSNSKFKLCLKVQDAADSKEMLKTADAANIVEPGRAYLQVGNNEIYELFQSAWSGADYFGEKSENKVDKRIYLVNRLGQHKLLTKDLSGIEEGKKIEKIPTELEAIVEEVKEVFDATKLNKVRPIWVEDLQEKYYLDDYITVDHSLSIPKIALGVVDIPSEQTQKMFDESLEDLGNIALLGRSGYGKSYTLMTALLSIFSRTKVEEVYSYILDFGNNSLINMRHLPHVAEYMTIDDDEKLGKFANLLKETVNERKKLFARAGANHISIYNQISAEKLPNLIVVVDNFDIVKEEFNGLEEMFSKLSRDCTSLGIYFIFSGQKTSSFKAKMVSNLKTVIALYGLDKHEYNNVAGKGQFLPKDRPGSALIRMDGKASVMQVMLPALGEDDVSQLNALRDKIKFISQNYQGQKAKGIMIVDENITFEAIKDSCDLKEGEVVVGIDYGNVKPVTLDFKSLPIFSVISSASRGKTNFIQLILSQNLADIVILDGMSNSLAFYKEKYPYYSLTDIKSLMFALDEEKLNGKILVTDAGDELIKGLDAIQSKRLSQKITEKELHLVIAYNASALRSKTGDLVNALKDVSYQIVQANPEDQNLVKFDMKTRKLKLKIGDVLLVNGDAIKKVRIPKWED